MSVDYLTAILVRLASREIEPLGRKKQDELRVIVRGPSFDSLLAESFDQIRQNAESNIAILICLLHALETIATETTSDRRKQALRQQAELVLPWAQRSSTSKRDRAIVDASWAHLSELLDERPRGLALRGSPTPSRASPSDRVR
jgi:uncharacterized membrane protein